MGYAIHRSGTFHLPGRSALSQEERQFYEFYYPATLDVNNGVFVHENLYTNYYYARAKNEKYVVVGVAGLMAQFLLDTDQVQRLNDAGISVVWMTLTKRQKGRLSMEDDIKLARAFLTSPSSPAAHLSPADVPRYVAGHSTGGQIILSLLHEDDTRKKLTGIFAGAAYISPYLRTANVSLKAAQHVFNRFAEYYKDVPIKKAALCKAYLAVTARNETIRGKPAEISPTGGHILEAQEYGQALLNRFDPAAASALPSFFVVGSRDSFASANTTINAVKKMKDHGGGADIFVAKGAKHDPIKEMPETLDILIGKVEECSKARKGPHYESTSPYRPPFPDLFDNGLMLSFHASMAANNLRGRASLALQRGAGFLNASAGLFQRFR
ncbi:MAG: alpha/beta hydrolase [Micavibrio sp.]